jgi:hypothetical protein
MVKTQIGNEKRLADFKRYLKIVLKKIQCGHRLREWDI